MTILLTFFMGIAALAYNSTAGPVFDSLGPGILALQIMLGSSLKVLWTMVNMLQFVIFFTEWNVLMPKNATDVIH